MTPPKLKAPIPRVTLARQEAAAALGISVETYRLNIEPDLRLVRLGRLRLAPVEELQRWVREHSERTLPEEAS